jgi:hypothetical protein
LIENNKKRKKERNGNIQSEGADTEGGIAIGESKTGVELGESTAAEEAVTVS